MNGARQAAVAAVDWGTSHLRIWLLDRDGMVLDERRSGEGLLKTGADGFAGVLARHLADMGTDDALPAIICGMAGSRQGWLEVPYVDVPAALDAVLGRAERVPGLAREVAIIPGLAQRDAAAPDVLRGEETQLAGVPGLRGAREALVAMPGTHSKWVVVRDGSVSGFGTWLTGELFSLLASQSILRHALAGADFAVAADDPTFAAWLGPAVAEPSTLSAALFRIRAATLLQGMQPAKAAAALSGLLIGSEIGAARQRFGAGVETVTLVASGPLGALYAAGLAQAGFTVARADAEAAVREGLAAAARQRWPQRIKPEVPA